MGFVARLALPFGLLAPAVDGLPLGALIGRLRHRLGRPERLQFAQQRRPILVGSQQVCFPARQRVELGLPGGGPGSEALCLPERVGRTLELLELAFEGLSAAQQQRALSGQAFDLRTSGRHQRGSLACIPQQLASPLQGHAAAGNGSGEGKAAGQLLGTQSGLTGCLLDPGEPLPCKYQCLARSCRLLDMPARVFHARDACCSDAARKRRSGLSPINPVRIGEQLIATAQPVLKHAALFTLQRDALRRAPTQPIRALSKIFLLPLPLDLETL
jgi:hypothetical protein